MGTVTASTYLKPPKALHAGVNAIVGEYASTISTGATLKAAKLPDRAVIVGGGIYRDAPGGDLTMRLKIPMVGASATASSTTTALATSTASGSLGLLGGFMNYQISVSDAVVDKTVELEIVNASASTTGPVKFNILYVLDDRE